jgi:hypothetical protein
MSQHVTEPLRVHKIEVVQEGVFKVQHRAVVMEKPDSLLQLPVARVLAD